MITYTEREQLKKAAWLRINDADTSLLVKSQALLDVIEAHYWRARESLEKQPKSEQRRIHGKRYCKGYELDIDVYTGHWLYANGNRIAPEIIAAVLMYWGYEPAESPFLMQGLTSYTIMHFTGC